MNLAYRFPIIFWDCANLIVDSGGTEDNIAKGTGTNYAKMAIGINRTKGFSDTELSLVDINESDFTFKPQLQDNKILFGLSGISGVGKELIQEIMEKRPYKGLDDFIERVSANRTAIISLIKAGAFDNFGERKDIMKQYLTKVSEPKKRITLQNFNMLSEKNLLPRELEPQKRIFRFNKALKKNKYEDYLILDGNNFYNFYSEFFDVDLLVPIGDKLGIKDTVWKKEYDAKMLPAKKYFKEHQEELLEKLNANLLQEQWDKYAEGNYSSWEMASLGMYYHDHELKNIDVMSHNIRTYEALPTEPVIEYMFKRNGKEIPIFKTYQIVGTVIAKDDLHSSISLLTVNGSVVTVKLNRDYYAKYNRRISELNEEGVKKVKEQSWFSKGTLIMLNGFRRGDSFVTKTYAKDRKEGKHQLYKITKIWDNGKIEFTNSRYGEELEDEKL